MRKRRARSAGIIISLMVLVAAFGILILSDAGPTGLASLSDRPDDDNSFYRRYANMARVDSAPEVFKKRIEMVKKIVEASLDLGYQYPEVAVAQFYVESDLIPNQLSCVCGAESRVQDYVARCKSFGCDARTDGFVCSYPGCDQPQLDFAKRSSRNAGKHQTQCCIGLGQVWYMTALDEGWARSPSELLEPASNAMIGIKYMQTLLRRYGGDLVYALAAYNWGMGNVDKKKELFGDDHASFLGSLPPETRQYVATILWVAPIASQMIDGMEVRAPKEWEVPEGVYSYVKENYGFDAPSISRIPSTMIEANPDFRVNIPYSFSEYDTLKKQAMALVDACSGGKDTEECIKEQIEAYSSESDLEWSYGDDCLVSHSGLPDDFVEFLSYFEECASSVNSGCTCSPKKGGAYDYEIRQVGDNVEVSATIGSRTYMHAYQFLEVADDAIKSRDGRYFTLGKGEFLGKDAAGKLTDRGNIYVGCVSDVERTFPFCVTSGKSMQMADGQFAGPQSIIYRFALVFSSRNGGPLSSARYRGTGVITSINDDGKSRLVTKVGEAV